MTGDQLFGLSSVITAVSLITGQAITFAQGRRVRKGVDAVHDAVRTSNGHTIGELIEANGLPNLEPPTSTPERPWSRPCT